MDRPRGSGGQSKSDRNKRKTPLTERRSTTTLTEGGRGGTPCDTGKTFEAVAHLVEQDQNRDRPGSARNSAIVEARRCLPSGRPCVHIRSQPIRQQPIPSPANLFPLLQPVPHFHRRRLFCLCPTLQILQSGSFDPKSRRPDRIVHQGATGYPEPPAESQGGVQPPQSRHPGSWLCSGRNG